MGQHNAGKDGQRVRDDKHAGHGTAKDTGYVGRHRDKNDDPTHDEVKK